MVYKWEQKQNDRRKVAIFHIGTSVVKKVFNGGLVWACCLKIIFYLGFYLSESKILGLSDKWFKNGSENKTIIGKSENRINLPFDYSNTYMMFLSKSLVNLSTCTLVKISKWVHHKWFTMIISYLVLSLERLFWYYYRIKHCCWIYIVKCGYPTDVGTILQMRAETKRSPESYDF